MYFTNVVGYTTSKNNDEILLSGIYDVTEKILNGRVKCVAKDDDKVVWVAQETLEALEQERIAFVKKAEEKLAELKSQKGVQIQEKVVSEPKTDSKTVLYHRVKRGETLQGIANRYNVTPQSIVTVNGTHTLAIGSCVKINKGE